mgnify:FL=1|jgi:uncharacterized RDD family membrane protein YckC
MDSKVNFSSYSLAELYESKEAIDSNKYPEKAKEIDRLIQDKLINCPEELDTSKETGKVATRGDRFVAALIDGILAIIAMVPVISYVGFDALKAPTLTLLAAFFLYGVLTVVILHGYLLYHYGQTIGKNYMSIRIENLDGTKANLTTIYFKRMLPMQLIALIPSFGQLISGFINPLFIFGKQKRCLHDYIAKTKVSYTDA